MFPLRPLPHIQHHNTAMWVASPGEYLRLHPLECTGRQRQKNMAQMKEQIKAPKIELSFKETTNLSDAEFKTLLIRILTKMVVYVQKIEEKVKTMQSEIKKNIQGTNSERKETRTQINNLDQRKK